MVDQVVFPVCHAFPPLRRLTAMSSIPSAGRLALVWVFFVFTEARSFVMQCVEDPWMRSQRILLSGMLWFAVLACSRPEISVPAAAVGSAEQCVSSSDCRDGLICHEGRYCCGQSEAGDCRTRCASLHQKPRVLADLQSGITVFEPLSMTECVVQCCEGQSEPMQLTQ